MTILQKWGIVLLNKRLKGGFILVTWTRSRVIISFIFLLTCVISSLAYVGIIGWEKLGLECSFLNLFNAVIGGILFVISLIVWKVTPYYRKDPSACCGVELCGAFSPKGRECNLKEGHSGPHKNTELPEHSWQGGGNK